ncbi:MAG: DUF3466 family protein [Opitutaceae bacterium]|jgi:hypothetical protein|nr:DUF3466 family protein [Opitutaceae bacterium]
MKTTPETRHPRRSRRTLPVLTNLALAAALSGLTVTASAAAADWEITAKPVDSNHSSEIEVRAINDSGIIVGSFPHSGTFGYWPSVGSDLAYLTRPPAGSEEGGGNVTGINNSGIVSGYDTWYDASLDTEDGEGWPYENRAAYWRLSADGTSTVHSLGPGSRTIDVNNNGHIFGYNSNNIWGYWDTNDNDTWHNWTVSSGEYKASAVASLASLGYTENSSLYLEGINDSNEVVGFIEEQIGGKWPPQPHAGYWNAEGEFVDLGPGWAYGINNNGMIVGKDDKANLMVWISNDGFDTWETVKLTAQVTLLINGSLYVINRGIAYDINDNNEIVATCTTYTGAVWQINDENGEWEWMEGEWTEWTEERGFYLKLTAVAVPEPGATVAVAGVVALLAACAAMRRRSADVADRRAGRPYVGLRVLSVTD